MPLSYTQKNFCRVLFFHIVSLQVCHSFPAQVISISSLGRTMFMLLRSAHACKEFDLFHTGWNTEISACARTHCRSISFLPRLPDLFSTHDMHSLYSRQCSISAGFSRVCAAKAPVKCLAAREQGKSRCCIFLSIINSRQVIRTTEVKTLFSVAAEKKNFVSF